MGKKLDNIDFIRNNIEKYFNVIGRPNTYGHVALLIVRLKYNFISILYNVRVYFGTLITDSEII
ncbi:hypothetical protein WH47_05906 [Habropoda laboriosa]|uniref:Uncharacterized protein n=1 Tax=Habropoda laboriosa TaxID=597456 RepID=A0A0L7REH0_9HYME|nr:hypothetical protein WH47_05906 [Habropoda laboriosa]